MKKLTSILILLTILVFVIPISINKAIAKQFSTSIPNNEGNSSSEIIDTNEFDIKILQNLKHINFSKDIFYIVVKEKFSYYIHHIFPVDWLKTFSQPPDIY